MTQLFQLFAQADKCSTPGFFSFPTWYKYLEVKFDGVTQKCEIQFSVMKANKFNGGDVLLVGLGVIDILIRIAALVAVGFVLFGGIKYITSQGSPEGTKSAQNTILNALIGLAIAVVASAVVAFLGSRIGA